MKTIAGLFGLCLSALGTEYLLTSLFGIWFTLAAGVAGLFVLFAALVRAPEADEDGDGCHISSGLKQELRRSHSLPGIKMGVTRLFSNS